jgi:cation diffusion facilitator CzcD-associated flavoprotein CzcO
MKDKHVDVIIIGAGLSGIGAACHLKKHCPEKSFAILESRASIGGTWDLFKYPGIRSDSDMHTLGYKFKPWLHKKAIADGPSILSYIRETSDENNITQHITFNTQVKKVSWSSQTNTWTIEAHNSEDNSLTLTTCNVLSICCGYYNYENGFTPEFAGISEFEGQVVHPQKWPDDLDYKGKKVVIIGSGATAMTLGPVLSKQAEHVTMLQRSPTYVVSRPSEDTTAKIVNKVLPKQVAYSLVRWKNIKFQQYLYTLSRKRPNVVKKKLLGALSKLLPEDYVAEHFTPSYMPWDQRVCLVPDNDLFDAINSKKLNMVTNTINTFTPKGITLSDGQELEADIVVTATGLDLLRLGGIEMVVDNKSIDIADTYIYKGIMYSGVPNLFNTFGYINSSWTLRADLIAEYMCKLINYMDKTHTTKMVPTVPMTDLNMPKSDMISDFSSNYMKRAMHEFPKQGNKAPWLNHQNYKLDKQTFNEEAIDDGVLIFSKLGDCCV